LIKENNEKEEELLDLTEFTKESLKGMISQEVQNYFEDTFETDLPIEDEVDEELQKIINELEFEFN
jgi:pyruvate-formate lyase-activating enzyme